MTTVGARLGAIVATDPTRPLLTWYDDGNGERVELSGATLANWVAKTANLLVDGVGAEPGDAAVALLPPHWQTAAVLLGCWSAGVEVHTGPVPAEVGFATPERGGELRSFGDRFVPATPIKDQDELLDAATARAGDLEIESGDRVMIDAARYPDPLNWLLAPLSVGASIVLCGHLNPEEVWERVGAERVTRNLTGG